MKTLVILQSNYLPWKGYFDLMAAADEFVVYDEVQFTRRDWRNRNRIVLDGKLHWLTLPVHAKGNYHAPICEIEVAEPNGAEKHWTTIQHAYRKAPYFGEIGCAFEQLFADAAGLKRLSGINWLFLRRIADFLGITTPLVDSRTVARTTDDPTERLVEICRARGALRYISGPAARSYIKKELFDAAGIELLYANYQGYPIYNQSMQPFEHGVSIIDTLMRCGAQARAHLKSRRVPEIFLVPA